MNCSCWQPKRSEQFFCSCPWTALDRIGCTDSNKIAFVASKRHFFFHLNSSFVNRNEWARVWKIESIESNCSVSMFTPVFLCMFISKVRYAFDLAGWFIDSCSFWKRSLIRAFCSFICVCNCLIGRFLVLHILSLILSFVSISL